MQDLDNRDSRDLKLSAIVVIYAGFVVYGSLVPLDFHRLAIADAWHAYLAMPHLTLGVASRADWTANLLLYIPLSFLLQGALAGLSKSKAIKVVAAGVTLVVCLVLAATVEFAQLFFPPRTVSVNDLVAEALGSLIGVFGWVLWGDAFLRASAILLSGGGAARKAALWIYVLAYLAWSLFPYDFVLSISELSTKLNAGNAAWMIAEGSRCDRTIACGLKSLVEVLGFLPFGILLANRGPPRGGELGRSLAVGMVLGLAIEFLQIFVASGVSQGLSVLTRGVGAVAGTALVRTLQGRHLSRGLKLRRPLTLLLALPYVAVVCYASGWFSSTWLDSRIAFDRLAEVNWLPLYYHYYTTETVATVSLTLTAVLYAMLGVARWLWSPNDSPSRAVWAAATLAGALATVMEAGKLFLPAKHPDPTNILIASIAAVLALSLCRLLARSAAPAAEAHADQAVTDVGAHRPQHGDASVPGTVSPVRSLDAKEEPDRPDASALRVTNRSPHVAALAHAVQLSALCATVLSIVEYPFPIPLAGFIACYLLLLWRYPHAWQIVVLAALPVLDFAHWTGRFFWDEFDILLLATIGSVATRLEFSGRTRSYGFPVLMGVVALTYLISLGVGMFPLSPLDGNAFNSYYSHFAGLRILRGLASAIALLVLLQGDKRSPADRMRSIAWGMAWGLALEVVFVCWERVSFSGLFNFSSDYRVTGTFSVMHTGGAYIEAYLAAAVPFLAYLAASTRSVFTWGFSTTVFLGAVYALMVTYSRGGYAALGIAGIVCALGVLFGAVRATDRLRRFVVAALFIALASSIAVPIWTGPYMKERFAAVGEDLAVRTAHWSDALAFRNQTPLNLLLGMGLGSYPETYFWRNRENVTPATYRIVAEGGNAFLRLGAGDSLYFDQLVPVVPHTRYELSFDARSVKGEGALTTPVCEKWMLYSYECEWHEFKLYGKPLEWRHFNISFNSKDLGSGWWFAQRTVKLTLFESGAGAVVDVDNVRLRSDFGEDLVRNGGFENGMDHWFFATDNHLPWHIKNLWVHLLFEQGWVGTVAVGVLTFATICVLLPAMFAGNYLATTLLASLLALLTIGMVDSLVDSPRHLLLFMLVIGLSWLYARDRGEGARILIRA